MNQDHQQYSDNSNRQLSDDELSFKDLILSIQAHFQELKSNWFYGLLVMAGMAGIFAYSAINSTITYPAKLTFMVNEDEGSGSAGGVNGLLLTLGLGGSSSDFNLKKILELSRTRYIMGEVLLHKATIGGEEDYFANHLIKLQNYQDTWEKDDYYDLGNFLFTNSKIDSFDLQENAALKFLVGKVAGNPKEGIEGLLRSFINDDTGIMELTIETTLEEFSIKFVRVLYKKLSDYYISKSTEKQRFTHGIIQAKADSLSKVMSSTQYALLNFQDRNRALSLRIADNKRLNLEKRLRISEVAYAEALKNLELSDFSLKNATPFFQIIDRPVSPIKASEESLLKNIVLGLLLGFFLITIWSVFRKSYRDVMAGS